MSAGEERGQHLVDGLFLADDPLAEFLNDRLPRPADAGEHGLMVCGDGLAVRPGSGGKRLRHGTPRSFEWQIKVSRLP